MKKRLFYFGMLMIAALSLTVMYSCDKEPDELLLDSMVATGDIDLNAATAPANVPTEAVITATFNTDLDAATVTTSTVTLTQDYDNADIPLDLSVAGNIVTITPQVILGNGALYQLQMTSGITTPEGLALTALTRSFTTVGTFVPTGVIAHWSFEETADDVVGDFDPASNQVVAITYTDSRNADAGKAATFDGDASIIEVPNGDDLINTDDFTLSFWVKTNSEGHTGGHFVMGLGAFYGIQYEIFGGYDGSKFAISYEVPGQEGNVSEDMWFPALATDNTTGGWQGWDFAKSLTADEMIALLKDSWLHVTYTYNSTEKAGTLYFNGEKMKSFDFDLWPEENQKRNVTGLKYMGSEPDVVNELAFGFVHSRAGTMWDSEPWGGYDFPDANHFKGQLDDVRIFHKALTATEIQLMYDSEK
ncbi:MAG: LamG-like jellyroll fold domain-containing protein [Bacteroidales bacterium]|nr:LamG-like jellyroll fold domain-containing protein [Bacteroidales bacterium]